MLQLGENEQQEGSSFWKAWKVFKRVCYIGCPPFPSSIVRKVAFHPPPKNESYLLQLINQPEKIITNAAQVYDDIFTLIPVGVPPSSIEYRHPSSTFVVYTDQKNYLIGLKCSPKRYSRNCPNHLDKVVIFAQPNSSDLGRFMHPSSFTLTNLADTLKVDVYGFDYSGYGYSTGRPSEKNIYSDIKAVYEYVLKDQPTKKIILMGYSIGTAAAVHLASSNPPGIVGVVLIAPLTSGLRLLGNEPFDTTSSICDSFQSFERVSSINMPVLICHGTHDDVISYDHAHALFNRLQRPVPMLLLYGADHATIFNFPQVFRRIFRFINVEVEEGHNICDQPMEEIL